MEQAGSRKGAGRAQEGSRKEEKGSRKEAGREKEGSSKGAGSGHGKA